MDFQQPPHRYLRPPAPPPLSMADPHPRHPVPPPPNPWYSTQFQYQHHSPSPPPPPPQQQQQLQQQQQQQWAAQPPPPPYPAPHPPYPAHHHTQYPPPPPPLPPLPPPYPQVNQDWDNSNWGHHQSWEYQAHSNGEDWAAKARAWAAAKAASDHHHPQPQFTPAGRPEEQNHYHDQYSQSIESHFPDMQKSSLPASNYQHYPAPAAPQHQAPISHPQEFAPFSLGQSSYGNLVGDSAAAFPQQENSSISSSVHQQEVPSSYSSVAGKEDAGQTGNYYVSSSLPVASAPQGHGQLPLPSGARSFSMEEPQYTFGGQSSEPATSLSDQPLEFAPHFKRDYESRTQSAYSDSGGRVRGVDTITSVPSNYTWDPSAGTGVVYPPVHTVPPAPSQVDPSMAVPPPIPGPSGPMFTRPPGPGFQPTVPAIGTSYNVGVGAALHPAAAFPVDAFGASSVSERPKKASVPNWLREEIIKKKAVIPSSAPDLPREDSQSIEDEDTHKSYEKGEQADSKSINSSRSTEEEEDDEGDVEVARTAAMNQEIKRVLTEVLLKVTDELFDEIATKVLNEGNITVQDDHSIGAPYREVSTSTQAAPTAKAEVKVLIPAKIKEADADDANVKLPSSSAGDILGLGSYASDDDEDNEIQSSGEPNSIETNNHLQSTSSRTSTGKNVVENGGLLEETKEHINEPAGLKNDAGRKSPNAARVIHSDVATQSSDDRPARELVKDEHLLEGVVTNLSKKTLGQKSVVETERPGESKISALDHSEGRESRNKSVKSERHETKRNSAGKDYVKEEESGKDKVYEKKDGTHRRHDEKHVKKERLDDRNGSKDKGKEKSGDKAKDSDSRKRPSPSDVKENKRENERERKASAKEDHDRKKERIKDDEGEKSRHKNASDPSRHKRHRRSSSVDSRGRDSKDSLVFSQINHSDDESSDDSRRKRHSRRHESPSPVRSKRRQVSRSPHSRHSQRRPSSHTSLDTKRGRRSRSRSRSPVRRRR